MSAAPAPVAGRLDSVQLLRAFAALMVVVGHVLGTLESFPERFGPVAHIRYAGGAGVDVFFLISGFIMVYASGRIFGSVAGARDFALRRLVRIVPPYWAATALMLLLLSAKPNGEAPTLAAAAASLFVPFDTLGRGDGFALPLLDLGWTLNYEMMFYAVFALGVPLGRLRGVAAVAAIMAGLVVLGAFVPPQATALHFWTRAIVLEFVAGMGIALLFAAGRLELPGWARWARWALVVLAVGWYLLDPTGLMGRPMTPNDLTRVGGWGVSAALLLVAALAGPLPLASRPARWGLMLGDASYVLYLIHPFVLIAMLQLFRGALAGSAAAPAMFIVTTLGGSCLAAAAAHLWLERPVVAWLTERLRRAGAPIGAVPLPPETAPRA